MTDTRFTQLVGCSLPLQLAPLGAAGSPPLTAAVANAGAHAVFSAMPVPLPVLEMQLNGIAGATEHAFGVNFTPAYLRDGALEIALKVAGMIEFGYSAPDRAIVERVHEGGCLASWQVPSVAEAVAAAEAGCDVVVVQGVEAASRLRGTVALLPLLCEVVDAVDIPVVATGGIATARGIAAVLAAGADAARCGTLFLATPESGAHEVYVRELLAATGEDAVLTSAFDRGLPAIGMLPARVLRSSLEAAEAFEGGDVVGEMRAGPVSTKVERFGGNPPTKMSSGAVEAMAMYAGQGAGLINTVRPAAEVVADLAAAFTAA